MCGYLGVISANNIDKAKLQNSNKFQICRGPDELKIDFGTMNELYKTSSELKCGFIFNRLSIQDLTDKGSQAMYSEEFNSLIMFNGEIFNHNELRNKLKSSGLNFKSSSSDTEVVLLGLSYFGIEYVNELIGQFSIFFIDFKKNLFYLIRDRLGQKPLFYTLDKKSIIFSSNLKTLISYKGNYTIKESSLVDYIEYGVVPSPFTLFNNIYKLKPAEILTFDISSHSDIKKSEIYWKPDDYIGNETFNSEKFNEKFSLAVNCRASADVPVANFLSGGLDSSSIVKAMSKESKEINTFSVGFDNQKYDESKWSRNVAEKYNTRHTEEKFETNNIDLEVIESIEAFDEVYCDPSNVPSYIISKQIAKNYKVAISGDGGDELLGGYDRNYIAINSKSNFSNYIANLYNIYPYFLGTGARIRSLSKEFQVSYKSFLADEKFKNYFVNNLEGNFHLENQINPNLDSFKSLMLTDYKFFLPEMMLLKVDRTSMANSLEIRSPFVDHRLVEYILGSDIETYNNLERKKVLKDYLLDDFGKSFTNRKKMGFAFDIDNWVYKNKEEINSKFQDGLIVKNINPDIFNPLSIRKSRINAIRIWKLYLLEVYINNINQDIS